MLHVACVAILGRKMKDGTAATHDSKQAPNWRQLTACVWSSTGSYRKGETVGE